MLINPLFTLNQKQTMAEPLKSIDLNLPVSPSKKSPKASGPSGPLAASPPMQPSQAKAPEPVIEDMFAQNKTTGANLQQNFARFRAERARVKKLQKISQKKKVREC